VADPQGILSIQRVRLPRTSRYRTTLVYPDLGPSFGRFDHRPLDLPSHESDDYHRVILGEQFRLDLVAWKRYGTPRLWWVLALINEIRNPFVAPAVNTLLRVPTIERVVSQILKQ